MEHGQALEVVLHFCDGRHGLIYLAPTGISFEACGVLNYTTGVPNDTAVTYTDGVFSFVHNGYGYTVPVSGAVTSEEDGYRLHGEGGVVKMNMAER